MGSQEVARPALGLLLRGGNYQKVHSANKDTLGIAWFLLADAIYAEEKVIGGEPAGTWEEDVIIVVRSVTLKENAPD